MNRAIRIGLAAVLLLIPIGGAADTAAITVTLLGTGNTGTDPVRFGASTLVQAGGQALLFDAGRGAFQRLNEAGATGAQIDAVFLTHLHSDHLVGLPEVWLSGWLFARRTSGLVLFGPPGTAALADHLTQAFSADLHARVEENAPDLPAAGAELKATDIQPGLVYERDGLRVTAVQVDHRSIAAFGYRVDYRGHSVVLSGDTQVSGKLIEAATGADLLIHEVFAVSDDLKRANPTFAKVQTLHVTPEEAGTVFTRAHPKMAVYSHIVLRGVSTEQLLERTRSTYGGPLVAGDDLTRFLVGDTVTIERARQSAAPTAIRR